MSVYSTRKNTSHKKAQKHKTLSGRLRDLKAFVILLYVTFVPFVAVWFVSFVYDLVRPVAFVSFGRLLIGVPWRRPLILPVVRDHLRWFFWRPFILVFALRECPGRHYAEHRYHQK